MSAQVAVLAIQLGLVILLARGFGILATKLKIPSVMGELVAGILFGPYFLGSIPLPFHGFENGLFPLNTDVVGISINPVLYSVAALGSILLLFLSGLETDVRTFFKYSVVGTFVGLGGIIFSFICGAAVGIFVLGWELMDPRCLFLGILCTATSVGISARILSEHHAMDTPEGVTIMAAAVIDDVLGIVCLAIVIGIANVELNGGAMAWGDIAWITVRSFGIWLGVTAFGLLIARRFAAFLRFFKSPRGFAILALGFALILAGLFEQVGLAMIIGAFVMGLSLSKTDVAFTVRSSLQPIYNFLVPVFFVTMGMLVDVRVLKDPHVLTVGIIFSAMAIIGKIVGCFVPAVLMNFNVLGALRVGIGMIPRCEVVLIIAGIAATTMMKNPALKPPRESAESTVQQQQIIRTSDAAAPQAVIQERVPIFDSRLFGIAIIMPLVTALLAPPLLSSVLAIKKKGVKRDVPDKSSRTMEFSFHTEALLPFVLNEFVELMVHDDFTYSGLPKDNRLIQFRRDKTSFSLEVIPPTTIRFTAAEEDFPLIKTAIYESVVELHRNLTELKQLVSPDAFRREVYDDNAQSTADTMPPSAVHETAHAEEPAHSGHDSHLASILLRQNVIMLNARTRDDAIRELTEALHASQPGIQSSLCIQDALERENIVSTYQGSGIAMPHARTAGTPRFLAAIGVSKQGFLYDDDASHIAHVVVLSLCPKDEPGPYLQFISSIAVVLDQPQKRQDILAAETTDAIYNVLIA